MQRIGEKLILNHPGNEEKQYFIFCYCKHCKPSPFGKQFCMLNKAIFISVFKVIKENISSKASVNFLNSLVLLDEIKI
jgi:hypothetical protein